MHVYQLRLIERKTFEAMDTLSRIETGYSGFDYPITAEILRQSRIVHSTYLYFLRGLQLLSPHLITHKEYVLDRREGYEKTKINTTIYKRVKAVLKGQHPETARVYPVLFTVPGDLTVVSYMGIVYSGENYRPLFLHLYESKIPIRYIVFPRYREDYLSHVVEELARENHVDLYETCLRLKVTYRRLQEDSRLFYGDTFYSTILKIRMLNAVHDVLFTDLTFKEIAYKNHFTDYHNMFKNFKKYHLQLKDIPRILR